jgi:hypothetical protein
MNHNGNTTGWKDFIYHDKPLNVYLDASMPVSFKSPGVYFRDTQVLNLGSIKGVEQAKSAVLKIYAENDFPVSIRMKAYLLDANQMVLDSITPEELIPASEVNQTNGAVISRSSATLLAPVSEAGMENLRRARYIVFVPRLNTEGSDYRKLYSFYRLKLRLVGQVTIANSF